MRNLLRAFFVLLFLSLSFQVVFAQDVSETPTPTPEVIRQVQYTLPYPGILPDSPLYFIKALRDNLIGFFVSDGVKKADYDLLMADKRLVSAKALLSEGKSDLALTTLSKSGNYFDLAIQQIASAKKQGQNAEPTISRLITASQKHQEIILEMEQGSKGQTKENLGLLRGRVQGFQKSVEALLSN